MDAPTLDDIANSKELSKATGYSERKKKSVVTVRMTEEQHMSLLQEAKRLKMSLNKLCVLRLNQFLSNQRN